MELIDNSDSINNGDQILGNSMLNDENNDVENSHEPFEDDPVIAPRNVQIIQFQHDEEEKVIDNSNVIDMSRQRHQLSAVIEEDADIGSVSQSNQNMSNIIMRSSAGNASNFILRSSGGSIHDQPSDEDSDVDSPAHN